MKLKLYLTYENKRKIDINQDLIIRKRDTVIYDCWFVVDITGATIFFTIKTKPSDTDDNAILQKTITTLTDASNGEAEIELSPTDTNLIVGNYLYDIAIKNSDGDIFTVLEGNICVMQDITIRTS